MRNMIDLLVWWASLLVLMVMVWPSGSVQVFVIGVGFIKFLIGAISLVTKAKREPCGGFPIQ
jgi:hypothetical protein